MGVHDSLPEGTGQGEPRPGRLRRMLLDVAVPFVISRVGLLAVASLSQGLPFNEGYADQIGGTAARGWAYTSNRLLDVWARWDANWYVITVQDGYSAAGFHEGQWSNLAFFPAYPQLARLFYRALPDGLQTRMAAFWLLFVLANLCALVALAALAEWSGERYGRDVGRRAVVYVLAFPTAFFLSCLFTEPLFLMLAVLAFAAGTHGRWGLAAAAGFFLALSRPTGIAIAPALAWLYLESVDFEWRRLRWGAALTLVPIAGTLVYGAYLYSLTGDPLAVVHVQRGWGRALSTPWQTVFAPSIVNRLVTPLDAAVVVAFTVGGFILSRRQALGSASFGIFVLISLVPVLTSGTLQSASRFGLVLFPVFVWLARRGQRVWVDRSVLMVGTLVQGLLMAAWSQGYFVA